MHFSSSNERLSADTTSTLRALLLLFCAWGYSTLAWPQTTALVCIGSKSVASVGGQNSQWNNFHQTYVFQDGKLSNSTPDVMDENFLSFQLTPTDDAVCEKFCNHRVVYNVSTGVIFDVNHSFENMIQHQWEFKGKCRTD